MENSSQLLVSHFSGAVPRTVEMYKYALKRLAIAIPTFVAVLIITFTLTALSPFDPVAMMMAQFEGTLDTLARDDVIEKIREQYGLNDSYGVQFTRWIRRLMQGDLGISINGQRNVLRMIVKTFPISFQLGLAGAVVTTLLGIPLGCLAALKQNTWIDYTIVGGTLGFRNRAGLCAGALAAGPLCPGAGYHECAARLGRLISDQSNSARVYSCSGALAGRCTPDPRRGS